MVQFIFKVVMVERGQESIWRGWSDEARGRRAVERCVLIEARHVEEAVSAVAKRFPDFTVMREGSERICSA